MPPEHPCTGAGNKKGGNGCFEYPMDGSCSPMMTHCPGSEAATPDMMRVGGGELGSSQLYVSGSIDGTTTTFWIHHESTCKQTDVVSGIPFPVGPLTQKCGCCKTQKV